MKFDLRDKESCLIEPGDVIVTNSDTYLIIKIGGNVALLSLTKVIVYLEDYYFSEVKEVIEHVDGVWCESILRYIKSDHLTLSEK